MLKRTKIKTLLQSEQTIAQVLVKGWVKTKRDSKDFSFIEINDGSCLKNIQVHLSCFRYTGIKLRGKPSDRRFIAARHPTIT